MKLWIVPAVLTSVALGCVHQPRPVEMCGYAGMASVPASSPQCIPPAPPPPPPPPPPPIPMCQYPGMETLPASDPDCGPPPVLLAPNLAGELEKPVFFRAGSTTLTPAAAKSIDEMVGLLRAYKGARLRIEGNDDGARTAADAEAIGNQRALQVKKRFMLAGIDGSRFEIVSFGRERPLCGDKTETCRAKNRRVDFYLLTTGESGHEVGELTTPTLDSLPWPPPKPSIRELLPLNLCHDPKNPTLQGSWNLVHAAFERAGFPDDERTFAIGKNEGFALLGRMEAINDDGTPKPEAARWGDPLRGDPGGFSVGQWFKEVFSRVTGRYRVIAIVMTLRPLTTTLKAPSFAHLDSLVDSGPIGPPPAEIAAMRMPPTIPCYALIYELERPSIPKNTAIVYPSQHSAREHLAKARLWTKTQLRLR